MGIPDIDSRGKLPENQSVVQVQKQVSLKDYTSWQIGGMADYFCLPETEEQVLEALEFARQKAVPWTVLGSGSNVLVSDDGVDGLVLCLRRFSKMEVREDGGRLILDCTSGTGKSELLKVFLKYKLAPALFLAGLPGDVGGGIVMNAGVAETFAPREFFELVEWFDVLKETADGFSTKRYFRDEVEWSYRHSRGWQPGLVLRARLSWENQPDPEILQRVRDANRMRLSKQPLDMPSCGSVFVNPPGYKAAQLIDGCGLKGHQVGGAQVSTKHANFIVNLGGATANDVKQVIAHVQKTVKDQKGVDLHTEVVFMGRNLS